MHSDFVVGCNKRLANAMLWCCLSVNFCILLKLLCSTSSSKSLSKSELIDKGRKGCQKEVSRSWRLWLFEVKRLHHSVGTSKF